MIKLLVKTLIIGSALSLMIFAGFKVTNTIKAASFDNNIVVASFNNSKIPLKGKKSNKNKPLLKEAVFVNDVSLYMDGAKADSTNCILRKYNRFYFSIHSIGKMFGYSIKIDNEKLRIYEEDADNPVYIETNLIHPSISSNDTEYISMIDLTEAFNLRATWDYDKRELRFFKNKFSLPKEQRRHFKRPALIRFEDVTAGIYYIDSESLEKIRVVSDFMYSKDIPYHIAWIPRYKSPEKNIDNDLLKNYSIPNVDFVYTLDHMVSKGGIIGLHGYTHQYGNEESIIGSEFGKEWCMDPQETKGGVERAIFTANELDLPYEFFESPHYDATKEQQIFFESYFDYIFEPSKQLFNSKPALSINNKKTIYVPAPLSFVRDNNVEDMIARIKAKPKDQIAALFYHPFKEVQYITITRKNGYPEYEYSENSILHRLIKCFNEEGYTPVKITDIRIPKKSS